MSYEVSQGTLAIVPASETGSKIFEDENEYLVDMVPFEVVENSCQYYGSSYEGRRDGARSILGSDYKVPIVIEDYNTLIFFPTASPNNPSCCWIASRKVKNYEPIDSTSIKIVFENDITIVLPISFRTFQNQLLRATRLESLLRNRKLQKLPNE